MTPKQIVSFAFGPLGAAALGLITVPVLTWFFSPEDIGRLTMLQITISFSILLFGLGLDQAYVREYYDVSNKPKLMLEALLPGFSIIMILSAIMLIKPSLVSALLFDLESVYVGFLVVLIVQSSFISRILSLFLRMQERGLAFSLSQLLPKLFFLGIVGLYVFLDFNFDFYHLIAAQALSILAAFSILLWNSYGEWRAAIKERIDFRYIKLMLRYSLPLIFGGVAYWGLTTIDKIFIRNLASFEELGIYSVAVSFAAAATIFQGIFGLLWSPWIYKLLSENKIMMPMIESIKRKVVFVVVLIFCFMGIFSWMIDWVLPSKYGEVKYMVLSCVGLPLFYTLSEVTGIGIGITKKTSLFMVVTVISFLFCLVLNYMLVPTYGGAGAAIGTCTSLWLFFILKTEVSNFVWNKLSRMDMYLIPTACMLIANIMAINVLPYFYIMLSWLCMLIVSSCIYRKEAVEIFCYIRSIINKNNSLKVL